MEKAVLNVEGMSCEHCVNAITKAVSALNGVKGVLVNLAARTVAVEYDPARIMLDSIRLEIEDQGYDIG